MPQNQVRAAALRRQYELSGPGGNADWQRAETFGIACYCGFYITAVDGAGKILAHPGSRHEGLVTTEGKGHTNGTKSEEFTADARRLGELRLLVAGGWRFWRFGLCGRRQRVITGLGINLEVG